jgi:hypothetical protein
MMFPHDDMEKQLQKMLIKMSVLEKELNGKGFAKNDDDMYEYIGDVENDKRKYYDCDDDAPYGKTRKVLEQEAYDFGYMDARLCFEQKAKDAFNEGYKKAMKDLGTASQPPKPTEEQVEESLSIVEQLL